MHREAAAYWIARLNRAMTTVGAGRSFAFPSMPETEPNCRRCPWAANAICLAFADMADWGGRSTREMESTKQETAMFRRNFCLTIALAVLIPCFASAPAHAQATRTWVSGVGDDVNPCSRTAPCKTFAGAISKTAAGGEINCLDPAGYGAVTIVKSITIDCEGTLGSILASLVNGVIINGAGINVVLRNISINGAGNGIRGVNILAANAVWIENLKIFGFTQQGIRDARSASGTLSILNTAIRNNTGAGLGVAPSGGTVKMLINNLHALNNGFGIAAGPNVQGTIRNSDLSNNTTAGISNEGANLVANNNSMSNNGSGVLNSAGVIRLSNNDIAHSTTSINNAGGTVISFGNNRTNTPTAGAITPAGGASSDLGQQ
ncbi:right-handed parallel beta-helix repeat-containing protein [Bradyrhizobium tropiciagri]|uniref:right-handed parallel beta-helix repeat-containing protein n=1 Tax=Bradyrhizobium tropiciagri TaxID=312253 RepID=UPI001BA7AC28|nr:right-handed parallel beta-helix repeat-containing protein [Bradyrhizobium tropiciagri]MBR0873198.1 right-handed parallel beta-helix repeat-containing protein [Bradyrhizobium tropiciagri]